MASKKTWVWVVVAVVAVGILGLSALAGLAMYFLASNISSDRTSGAEALRAFDTVRADFRDAEPLFEVEAGEEPRLTRRLADLPASPEKPTHLWILAWDPDRERLSKISLPFWMLRLGKQNIDVRSGHDFDLRDLDLDVAELERVGPRLIFDLRTAEGERVMVWTK